jgi:hypothetical protein
LLATDGWNDFITLSILTCQKETYKGSQYKIEERQSAMVQRYRFWFLPCVYMLFALIFTYPTFAEIKVFEKEVEAIIGEGQAQRQVESLALQMAKRLAVMFWNTAVAPSGTGYVAVFIEGNTHRFSSFDQNWPKGSKAHV